MPIHGLKTNGELGFLVASAAFISYFLTGELVSNVLFATLLGTLFFLEGLQVDINRIMNFTRSDSFSLGFLSVYVIVPIISLIFAFIFPRFEQLFLVLGVSSATVSSPMVWSSLAGGDSKTAETTSTVLLGLSLILTPFLMLAFIHLNLDLLAMFQNIYIVLIPFIIGLFLHNSDFEPLKDMRFHFSKLAFFLIVLITLVQLQLTIGEFGSYSLISYISLSAVLGFYVLFSFLAGYIPSKIYGLNEKNSVSLGFVSSARNIGVAFFLGSLISGEVVLLVGLYYIVRQVTGALISDYIAHSELRFRERVGF